MVKYIDNKFFDLGNISPLSNVCFVNSLLNGEFSCPKINPRRNHMFLVATNLEGLWEIYIGSVYLGFSYDHQSVYAYWRMYR